MALKIYQHISKNKKFWMAMLTIMCMVTFVLCTGLGQGGLEDRLMNLFQGGTGEVIARVDGRSYRHSQISDLRMQRNLANEFMRKSVEICVKELSKKIEDLEKDEKADKLTGQQIAQLRGLRDDLYSRIKRPRYFDTGVKLEDLVDFLVWRNQADRLDIRLVTEHVNGMMYEELYWRQTGYDPSWAAHVRRMELRGTQGATAEHIISALRDEFRVRLAKLALTQAQPLAFSLRSQEEQKKIKFQLPYETRAPLTPHELWQTYKEKRSEFDVALIPIDVEAFLKKTGEPSQAELQAVFKEYQKKPYDPTSATPGFQRPHRVKVQWVAADPKSKFYRTLATVVHHLEATPQSPWTGGVPALLTAAGPVLWEASLERNYENLRRRPFGREIYEFVPLTSADILPPLVARMATKPSPQAVATLVGSGVVTDNFAVFPSLFRSVMYHHKKKELEPLIRAEIRKRIPVYSQFVSAGSSGSAFVPAAIWHAASQPQLLPLGAVREEMEEHLLIADKGHAQTAIHKNMATLKRRLEETNIIGKQKAFEKVINALAKQYGLEVGETTEPVDRFSVAKAKGLESLRESYKKYYDVINRAESRETPEKRLEEGDFAKLFFEGSESFSVGNAKFVAKPWPPEVTEVLPGQRLFQDPNNPPRATLILWESVDKPFLFWKTEDQPAQFPEDLAEVKDRVERAWRLMKAREKFALPKAKEIAESLQKTGGLFGQAVRDEAQKLGTEPIYLRNVSPLYPVKVHPGATVYQEYPLPPEAKDRIDYPRDDMAKQVLALTDLKEPITVAIKDKKEALDEINKQLYEVTKKLAKEGAGKQVQILTNKPQTAYYVGVVLNAPDASRDHFVDAYRRAVGFGEDQFVVTAQDLASKRYHEMLIQQLRTNLSVWWDEKAAKDFADDAS
jgi:hypothetical protein